MAKSVCEQARGNYEATFEGKSRDVALGRQIDGFRPRTDRRWPNPCANKHVGIMRPPLRENRETLLSADKSTAFVLEPIGDGKIRVRTTWDGVLVQPGAAVAVSNRDNSEKHSPLGWQKPKLSHLRSGEPAAAGRSCDRSSWVGHGRGADEVMHRLRIRLPG